MNGLLCALFFIVCCLFVLYDGMREYVGMFARDKNAAEVSFFLRMQLIFFFVYVKIIKIKIKVRVGRSFLPPPVPV